MEKNVNIERGFSLHSRDQQGGGSNMQESSDKRKGNIAKGIDKLMVVSLFMIFFGLPLFFTGLTFQGVVFEKQIYFYFWTLLALISWAAKGAVLGEMKIRRTPLDIPIAIFFVVFAASSFFSVDRWHSIWGFFGDPSRGLMSVTAVILIYYLILSNFTKERMKLMISGLVISSVIVSAWSFLLFLGVDIVPDKIKQFIPFNIIGTGTGLKIFSGAMLPLIMLVIFNIDTEKGKFKNILSYVLMLFIPINLFITSVLYEKASAIIILVGVGFLLLYVLSHIVRPKEGVTWVPMVTFVLAMVVLIISNNNFSRVTIPLEVSPNANISWEIAKGSIKENPALGSGPGTYGFDFSAFKPQKFNLNTFFELRFYQATGLFFEALSTIGILGTLAFLAVAIAFINISIYLVSKDKEKNKLYSLGLLSSVLILMAGSFVLRVEGTILLLGGVLGGLAMAAMLWESGVEEKFINLSLKASPKFALTLAFIFIIVSSGVAALFVYVGKAYVADVYAGAGIRETEVSENSLRKITGAINLNNKEGRYYSRASQEFMVIANREALKPKEEQDINKIKDSINNALAYGETSVKYMPKDALALAVLAQIYENAGLYVFDTLNSAVDTYKKLLEIEPHNPIASLKIGQIKMTMASREQDENKRKEMVKEAKEFIEKSLKEKENLDPAYYYNSLAQSALGEKKEAIVSMSNAVSLDPNNITYLFNLGRLYQDRNEDKDNENAQKIFEYILTVNPDEINTNFSLGLTYERMKEKDKAIEKYNKVISLLGDSENEKSTKDQLSRMIENVRNGISNEKTGEQVNVSAEEQTPTPENIDLIEGGTNAGAGEAQASQANPQPQP